MTPRHYIALAIILAVLAAGLYAGYGYGKARGIREGAKIAQAERELTEAGWTEGRTGKPPPLEERIPDAAELDASVRVVVDYESQNPRFPSGREDGGVGRATPSGGGYTTAYGSSPQRDSGEPLPGVSPEPTTLPTQDGARPQDWRLTPGDLALDIRTDLVRVDGKPFGISKGTILARTPHGEVARPFSTQEPLAALDLWARETPPAARRIAAGLRKPRHWRAGWTAGAGALYAPDGSVHIGAALVWGVQF